MLHKLQQIGPLKVLQNVAVKKSDVFIVCSMSFFGKVKEKFGKGVSKIKQVSLFRRKRQPNQEEQPAPITDVDVTIARLKTQKRKINEQIRKVRDLVLIGYRLKEKRQNTTKRRFQSEIMEIRYCWSFSSTVGTSCKLL